MDLLKSALRSLRAHALFSALIILLLALGIGANTAIFGVVHAVLLKPLPYPEPGDLVMVRKPPRDSGMNIPGGGDMLPDTEFLSWVEAVPKTFRSLAAYRSASSTLQRGDGAVRVPTAAVTGGFFPLLGVTPWRGRLFTADDLKPGAAPTTVLSHAAWLARFNGADDALGQVVKIDDVAHTIIGVLPAAFEFTDPVQFWRPLPLAPGAPGQLRIQMVRVFGRLLPGTALDTATRELDELSERFWNNLTSGLFSGGPGGSSERRIVQGPGPARGAEQGTDSGPQPEREIQTAPGERRVIAGPGPEAGGERRVVTGPGIPAGGPPNITRQGGPGGPGGPGGFRLPFADNKAQLVRLQEQLARQSRTTLWLLLGAVGFVRLIACANIANLQLARAAGRRRDSAVRAALGASPFRLAAELLLENILLALVGGALGIVLAWWGTQALEAWLANFLPRINPIGVNLPVLGFAVAVAAVAGLGFGLAPAWAGSRVDLLDALKEGGHQSSSSGQRWRLGLVALEVALALVLAINAGLLVKGIYTLYSTELGYRTGDVLTANLALPSRYRTPAQQRDFADRWLAALQGLPGVKSAAITDVPPLSPYQQMVLSATADRRRGQANATVRSAPPAMAVGSASPDFFTAAGIALKQGRLFTAQDGPDAPAVAIVNETFLKTFHPDGFTLGAPVTLPNVAGGGGHGEPATAGIVGVVADVRPRGFESTAQPMAYFPLAQQPKPRLSAVVHFTGDDAPLIRALTEATHKIDSDLALDTPSTLEDQINRQNAPRRVTLMLTAIFAAAAVVLAALGIFGVMSYTVTQRTQEIGVRMALGADAGMILRWMLRSGGLAVATGLAGGTAMTIASGKLLSSLLTGVTTLDPLVAVAGITGLALVGMIACLLPARRATRVNPVDALRSE